MDYSIKLLKKGFSLEEVINIKPNMVIRIPSTASLVIKGGGFSIIIFCLYYFEKQMRRFAFIRNAYFSDTLKARSLS
jgi:hypothetical protein